MLFDYFEIKAENPKRHAKEMQSIVKGISEKHNKKYQIK